MPASRDVLTAVVFFGGYLLLDWVSFIHPMQALNITPWNPQPALAIGLLVLRGARWIPLVFAAILSAEIVVRDALAQATAAVTVSVVLTVGYAVIAWALKHRFAIKPALDSRRDVVRLTSVVSAGAFATAVVYVGALFALGARPQEGLVAATLKFWIGDGVGILVTLPLLFMLVEPRRRAEVARFFRRGETYAQAAAIGAVLWTVFGSPAGEPVKFFYLLFLPLIWVAVRGGLAGAVLALAAIESGIIVAVQMGNAATLTVFEVQALQIALTITGLFLGVTVDERERTAHQLRLSSRLAAAGNMAGALAHELNQPLTALSGYARAIQLLAAGPRLDAARLEETARKLVSEVHRAADVIQRVRDLFQSAEPQRAATELPHLVEAVAAALRPRAQQAGVSVACRSEPGLPQLEVDRVQIELVVRNLLLNAIDAAAEGGKTRRVEIDLAAAPDGFARIRVTDDGRGVAPENAERIFDPFFTSKASGMGMGLAISRAIVQSHGGRLDVVPGARGVFVVDLPYRAVQGASAA
jgi:signal transduction histidine kinase